MIEERQFVSEVTEMKDMLYRLSVSYLHSDADAQDAVQQALEKAWQHRSRVGDGAFRPWLTRIVINECKTQLRRAKRVQPSDQLEAYAGTTPPPDIALSDALSRLPDKLRTPLLLHYREGFSVEEVAKSLRVPASTVRSRLYRARNALRDQLTDGEEGKACARMR